MPEIAKDFLLGVAALLLRDHHHRLRIEPAHAGDDGVIVAEGAVAMQFVKIGEQTLDVIERVRTLGMARELHALPARIAWLEATGDDQTL